MGADIYSELVAMIGMESPPQTCVDECSKDMIRHFVEPIKDENPLYTNDEFAKNSKYGGIIAPPAMMYTWCLAPIWGPDGQEVKWREEVRRKDNPDPLSLVITKLEEAGYTLALSADITYEFIKPVVPGDRITSSEKLIAVSQEKKTRAGVGYFTTYVRTYWNQKGEVVCKQNYVNYKFKPQEA